MHGRRLSRSAARTQVRLIATTARALLGSHVTDTLKSFLVPLVEQEVFLL